MNSYEKHENLENLFLSNETIDKRDWILCINFSDETSLFRLGEKIEEGKVLVTRRRKIKELKKKLFEFGFLKKVIPIKENSLEKLPSNVFTKIVWVSPDIRKEKNITRLSLSYKLLKEGGKLYLLFDKEMKLLDEFIVKLLKKADVMATVGLLEKVGFKPPFYEKVFVGKNISSYVVIAKRIEDFFSPFDTIKP
ncbi:MAG: hypothetical protein J7J33_00750 [Caldisericia bacterium]|nr:hypothetical protein [Caldisericia bacterium]